MDRGPVDQEGVTEEEGQEDTEEGKRDMVEVGKVGMKVDLIVTQITARLL